MVETVVPMADLELADKILRDLLSYSSGAEVSEWLSWTRYQRPCLPPPPLNTRLILLILIASIIVVVLALEIGL